MPVTRSYPQGPDRAAMRVSGLLAPAEGGRERQSGEAASVDGRGLGRRSGQPWRPRRPPNAPASCGRRPFVADKRSVGGWSLVEHCSAVLGETRRCLRVFPKSSCCR